MPMQEAILENVRYGRGGSRKFRKRGTESPTLLSEWKLHFSGDRAYSIVGVFVMHSKATLTFRKIELKSILQNDFQDS